MTEQTMRLLEVMLEDPSADWYGLQLSEAAQLKSGTIYPALARLEHYGWLEGRWEEVDPSAAGRPKRRLYRLTRDGAATARTLIADARVNAARGARARGTARFGARPRGATA
jgi:PadR family transcriptional regulator, regulatory protein PadR